MAITIAEAGPSVLKPVIPPRWSEAQAREAWPDSNSAVLSADAPRIWRATGGMGFNGLEE